MRKALLLGSCCYLLMAPSLLWGASSATTTTGATGASATTLINQLSTAFSGGNVVHQVQRNLAGRQPERHRDGYAFRCYHRIVATAAFAVLFRHENRSTIGPG